MDTTLADFVKERGEKLVEISRTHALMKQSKPGNMSLLRKIWGSLLAVLIILGSSIHQSNVTFD